MGKAVLHVLRGDWKEEKQARVVQVVHASLSVKFSRVGRAHQLIDQEGRGCMRCSPKHSPAKSQLQLFPKFSNTAILVSHAWSWVAH